jgi:hypothetical protein
MWLDIQKVGVVPVKLYLHYNYMGDVLEIEPKEGD